MQSRAKRAPTPADPASASKLRAPLDARLDAEWFRALGEPTRLKLFAALAKCGRPCSVGELALCTEVDLSVVSRHLAQLQDAGLLDSAKRGRSVYYAVRYAQVAAALRELAAALDDCANGTPCCEPGVRCSTNTTTPRNSKEAPR